MTVLKVTHFGLLYGFTMLFKYFQIGFIKKVKKIVCDLKMVRHKLEDSVPLVYQKIGKI